MHLWDENGRRGASAESTESDKDSAVIVWPPRAVTDGLRSTLLLVIQMRNPGCQAPWFPVLKASAIISPRFSVTGTQTAGAENARCISGNPEDGCPYRRSPHSGSCSVTGVRLAVRDVLASIPRGNWEAIPEKAKFFRVKS